MEDDFYHKIPEKNKLIDEKQEEKVKEIVLDKMDTDIENKEANHQFKPDEKKKLVLVSDNRRPIYGVLTEPLRGDMQNRNSTEDILESRVDKFSYIPKAHVQFLEQSGIIVVPISFLDSDEEIISMLGEVNGIYIPGDSQKAITNKKYQKSFSTITKYVIDQNKKNGDYFPMFMMGKSCQTFITQVGASKHTL